MRGSNKMLPQGLKTGLFFEIQTVKSAHFKRKNATKASPYLIGGIIILKERTSTNSPVIKKMYFKSTMQYSFS